MTDHKGTKFNERQAAAAAAKQAMLDKFRARPAHDDPAVVARLEARRVADAKREVQQAEKAAARLADKKRRTEEEAAAAAERLRAEEAALVDKEAAELALKAEQKAQRDARYAARKARK